ncbi:MAG: hypothetical protein NVSMB38_24940 [Ktedonobacteraceae bacterium]
MYALETGNSLLFGSLSGGTPTTFATLDSTPQADLNTETIQSAIVGWTTM